MPAGLDAPRLRCWLPGRQAARPPAGLGPTWLARSGSYGRRRAHEGPGRGTAGSRAATAKCAGYTGGVQRLRQARVSLEIARHALGSPPVKKGRATVALAQAWERGDPARRAWRRCVSLKGTPRGSRAWLRQRGRQGCAVGGGVERHGKLDAAARSSKGRLALFCSGCSADPQRLPPWLVGELGGLVGKGDFPSGPTMR